MNYDRVVAVNILSIIPATGWAAVYLLDPDKDDTGETEMVIRLACWALVDCDDRGERFNMIRGVDPTGDFSGDDFADEASNFVEYRWIG